jgi:Sec-independent protein translocase protein TatA
MQMSMIGLVAVLGVGGFAVPAFAEEMGKMQTEMKTEGMTQKDAMKGQMKGQKESMKGEMKTKHDDRQGAMKTKQDDMKGEMKGAMGK